MEMKIGELKEIATNESRLLSRGTILKLIWDAWTVLRAGAISNSHMLRLYSHINFH